MSEEKSPAEFYFGYCTMLEAAEMKRLCPGARALGVYQLSGYRMRFSRFHDEPTQGSCDLEVLDGHRLWGVLYEMVGTEYDALDVMAGVDRGYLQRIDVTITNDNGDTRCATTYRSPRPGGAFKPSVAYTRPILAGAGELRLPAAYIQELEAIVAMAHA